MNKKLNIRKVALSFDEDEPYIYNINLLDSRQREALDEFVNSFKNFHGKVADGKYSSQALDIPPQDNYFEGIDFIDGSIKDKIHFIVLEMKKEGINRITNKLVRQRYKLKHVKTLNRSTVTESLKSCVFLEGRDKGRNKYYIYNQNFAYKEFESEIREKLGITY